MATARAPLLHRPQRTRDQPWPWRVALATVVASAMALSCWWVLRVPIFQAPDEDVHFDYVVSLVTAGKLLRASERPVAEMVPGGFFSPFNPYSHPYTLHLEVRTRAKVIRFLPKLRTPEGYGSKEYFAAIDRGAPVLTRPPFRNPFLLTEYPVGYYALAALWASAGQHLFPGLVALFFATRAFSVLLLGIGLLATCGMFRRLGCPPARAFGLTAAVGLFPLTTFVSSYVQPDNLAFAAVAMCLWLALRAAASHRLSRSADLAAVGAALAVLLLAKYHVFMALALPVLVLLAWKEVQHGGRRWLEWGLLLVGPTLLAAELQLWVTAGGAGPRLRNLSDASSRWQLMQEAGSKPVYLVRVLRSAVHNFLAIDGATFETFWGTFGWNDTPLVIVSPAVQEVLTFVIQAGAVVLLALLALRAQQVVTAILVLWRRGERPRALSLLVANPLASGHLLFAAGLVAIYVITNNGFLAQGRNWYPFLPAIFWEAVEYAPRALASRRAARWLSRGVLATLLLYGVVGSYWAMRAVEERFYGVTGVSQQPTRGAALLSSP